MLTIRLQRRGRKNDPSFRVIVVDSKTAPKSGKYLELVGSYDPRTDRVELKGERILHWMKEGASVSGTVHNLLVSQKIIEGEKINVLPKKSAPKKEEASAEEKSENVTKDTTEETAPATETPEEAPASQEAKSEDESVGSGVATS